MLHATPPPLDRHENPQDQGRDYDVHAEEAADRICEELIDELAGVEAMLPKEVDKLGIRQYGPEYAQPQIQYSWRHKTLLKHSLDMPLSGLKAST